MSCFYNNILKCLNKEEEIIEVGVLEAEVTEVEDLVVAAEEEADFKQITNLEETTINKTTSKTNKTSMDSSNLCKVVNSLKEEETFSHKINISNNNNKTKFLFMNKFVILEIDASPEMEDRALEFAPPKTIR